MDDVYAIADDGPTYLNSRTFGTLRKRGREREWPRAPEFISQGDTDADLSSAGHLTLVVDGETLGEVLDGTAEEAAAAIDSGACDAYLDALLFAEREHENRTTVVNAIAARSDYLANREDQEDADTIDTSDIVTV